MLQDDDDDPETAPRRRWPRAWLIGWLAAGAVPLAIVALEHLPPAHATSEDLERSNRGIEVRIPPGDPRADLTWCELMGRDYLDLRSVNLRATLEQYRITDPRACHTPVGEHGPDRPLVIIPDQDGENFCDCRDAP